MSENEFELAFKAVVKGYNCITPYVIEHGGNDNYVYELSKGKSDPPIREGVGSNLNYGVTVVNRKTMRLSKGLSLPFGTIEEARVYIKIILIQRST